MNEFCKLLTFIFFGFSSSLLVKFDLLSTVMSLNYLGSTCGLVNTVVAVLHPKYHSSTFWAAEMCCFPDMCGTSLI